MAQPARDPAHAIEILASPQRDGCSYELHPLSKRLLLDRHPKLSLPPSLFVGYDTQSDFEALHGKMWAQIITLLTSLPMRRLADVGGVYIVNTNDGRILDDSRPKAVA